MIRNLLLISLFGLFVISSKAQSADVDKMPTIKVTGTAEIQVVPDTATLSFTIARKDKTVAIAKKRNDETVAKVADDTTLTQKIKRKIFLYRATGRSRYQGSLKRKTLETVRVGLSNIRAKMRT